MVNKKSLLLICLVLVICSGVFAAEQSSSPYRAMANVEVSALTATQPDRTIYYVDGLFPLYLSGDGNTLVFLSPKQNWQQPMASETNTGIGVRKIFNDNYILGMNLFYDRSFSVNHIWHEQTGVGVEYLSEPLDVRVNYYHPNERKVALSPAYEFGSLGLVANENYEEAMEGSDIEIGGPVYPLNLLNTRTYIGSFSYHSTIADDILGIHLRTESKLNDWLSMDMTFDKSSDDTSFIGGLRATLPIELNKIFSWQNPISNVKLPYLKDRLYERVVRDIDIKTSSTPSPVKQPVPGMDIIYVDNSAPAGGNGTFEHPYNTLSSAFLDPRYIGLGGKASTIYVYKGTGTASGYTGSYSLSDNVTLWGSGCNGGFTGLPVFGNPLVSGTKCGGDVLTLANGDVVQGLQISNSGNGYGIKASNVSYDTIQYNTISGNAKGGIYINGTAGNAVSNYVINNNIISNNGEGIYIYNNGSDMSNIFMSANNIMNNSYRCADGNGIDIYNKKGSMENIVAQDSAISGNSGRGINICNNAPMDGLTISGLTVESNSSDGIGISNSASMSDLAFSNNKIDYNSGYGIKFDNSGSLQSVFMDGGIINKNWSDGMNIQNDGLMTDLFLSETAITANAGNGINIANNGTMENIYIGDNTISSNKYDGINIVNNGSVYRGSDNDGHGCYSYNVLCGDGHENNTPDIPGSISFLDLSGNTISSNLNNGIDLVNNGSMNYTAIEYNLLSSNKGDGISIQNGSASDNYDYSCYRYSFCGKGSDDKKTVNGSSSANLIVSDNTISYNSGNGMDIVNYGTMEGTYFFFNNISLNKGDGVYIQNGPISSQCGYSCYQSVFCVGPACNPPSSGATISDATFLGNVITNNKGCGVNLKGSGSSNIILGDDVNGIGGYNSIYGNGDGKKTFNLTNNSGINGLLAQDNFWGGGDLKAGGSNTVISDPYLAIDPN